MWDIGIRSQFPHLNNFKMLRVSSGWVIGWEPTHVKVAMIEKILISNYLVVRR